MGCKHKKGTPGHPCCVEECVPVESFPDEAFDNEDDAWTKTEFGYWVTTTADKHLLTDWEIAGATAAHIAVNLGWPQGVITRVVFHWQDGDNYLAFELRSTMTGGVESCLVRLIKRSEGVETILTEGQPFTRTIGSYYLGTAKVSIDYDANRAGMYLALTGVASWDWWFGWPDCEIGDDLSGAFGQIPVSGPEGTTFVAYNNEIACTVLARVCGCASDDPDVGISPYAQYQITIAGCTGSAAWANGTYLAAGDFWTYGGWIVGGKVCTWALQSGGVTLLLTEAIAAFPSPPMTLRITQDSSGKWIQYRAAAGVSCNAADIALAFYNANGISPASDVNTSTATAEGIGP